MANRVEVHWNDGWESRVDLTSMFSRLGGAIQSDAERYAPVDTGFLQAHIGHEVVSESYKGFNQTLVIFSEADYSTYVELGTSRMQAQPYLRPALEQRRSV